MMISAKCTNCPEVEIKVDAGFNTAYYGPTILCGKCGMSMLTSQLTFMSGTVSYPSGTAVIPLNFETMTVTNLPPVNYSMPTINFGPGVIPKCKCSAYTLANGCTCGTCYATGGGPGGSSGGLGGGGGG